MDGGKLYIVATPIGNLGDITLRAIETLRAADFIAAEDTRVTGGLLSHLGISKPIISYHEHNENERAELILRRVADGESCALVSDAGTPVISDPGLKLVEAAAKQGIPVCPVPGACAAICALSASPLQSGRFCFEGFLPMNKRARRERLDEIKHETRTMVFYEAPHKIERTVNDLLLALGDREVTAARELTKLHEEICPTTLSKLSASFADKPPRGEYVLIVQGDPEPPEKERPLSRNERYKLKLMEKEDVPDGG